MATESPLIHDGGQCILGFDARNSTYSGSTLAGPSGSGQYLAVLMSTVAVSTPGIEKMGVLNGAMLRQ